MDKLGASGQKMRITIDTIGVPHTMSTYAVKGIEICNLQMDSFVELPRLYTKEKMPVSRGHIPTNDDISNWSHLSDVTLPQINADIGLLIGKNHVPDAYSPIEVRTGPRGSPHSTRTLIGWVAWNVIRGTHSEVPVSVNRADVTIIRESEKLDKLNRLVRDSYNYDFPEKTTEDKWEYSQEDNKFLEKIKTFMKMKNKHYEFSLPFKNDNFVFPDNKAQAIQRLSSLERKVKRNPQFLANYSDFMSKIIDKGYSRLP